MDGWSAESYWLDGMAPQPALPDDLPTDVDVVIVGSGYTGLNAAIETARGGKSTLVLDAGVPGFGCSTRKGGQISTSIKPSLDKLMAKYGAERGRAMRQVGETALSWIEERIADEKIDCHFNRVGRFHAAHTPQFYEDLAQDAEKLTRTEGIEAQTSSMSWAAICIMAAWSIPTTPRLIRRVIITGCWTAPCPPGQRCAGIAR